MSVDDTDIRISEPKPFHPGFYSHKFEDAGLRYELDVSVYNGSIVWLHGPFPAGKYSDQAIFNLKMRNALLKNEVVLTDRGYGGSKVVHDSIDADSSNQRTGRLRAYHENVNGCLKLFGSLNQKWRHPLEKHPTCFFAVVTVVQLKIEKQS